MLAFWNSGNPRAIRNPAKVVLGNGNAIFNAQVDAANDIYNYVVVGSRPADYQILGTATHDLTGDTITTTYANVDRPLAEVKAQVYRKIDGMRDGVAYGGITFSVHPIATDLVSVDTINLVASSLSDGETLPAGFSWESMQGVRFNLTDAQFRSLRNAVAQHLIAARKTAAGHKRAVEALTAVAEVVGYDFSTGWPANPI